MKTEIETKSLLENYGIATTRPSLARDAQEAAEIAARLGKPVAMKVVSPDIVHKAAVGGVHLEVAPENVGRAFESIIETCQQSCPDAKLEGVLLEEMISGGLEVFIGARWDTEYGPVVLLGVGGTNVEQGATPAAALAPLNEFLAADLIGTALEGALQNRLTSVSLAKLRSYLMAIAGPNGLLLQENIGDLDINPIIVDETQAIAVDAVASELSIRHEERGVQAYEEAVRFRRARLDGLDALFEPQSIAFVGASTSPNKLGYRSIKNLLDFGFAGSRIYPIHPVAEEICGLRAYQSIQDVPGSVDRAYIAVAAPKVPEILADCASQGVKVAQVLTAGFSEWSSGDGSDGEALEAQIKRVLAGSRLRMVGPNCIGTFSVSGRLAMGASRYCPTEPGDITFISQSGTFAGDVVRRAQVLGVPVDQVLSCGNCSDLDLVDYLLYCESDPKTAFIAFYIESLKDPALFFRVAEKSKKPIVILKGGTTDQGVVAASSHTAALATNKMLWDAAIRQAGILQVHSIDELMDTFLIRSAHGSLNGNKLGIFGSGGGVSVTSADEAARMGMAVLPVEETTSAALKRFGVPGTSVANPIDIPVWGLHDGNHYILEEIVNLLKGDANIDSLIVYVEMGSIMDFADNEREGLRQLEEICTSVSQSSPEGPKVTLCLRSTGDKYQEDFIRAQRVRLLRDGIAVFPSTAQAVRAHARLWTISGKERRRAEDQSQNWNNVISLVEQE